MRISRQQLTCIDENPRITALVQLGLDEGILMSISKFVIMSLLGASVGIASANLGIASANAATITNNFVFTDEANSVVASGSFSYDSSLTGTIGYSDLSAFSITLANQSYILPS